MNFSLWQISPVILFMIFIAPVAIVLFSLTGDYSENWLHLYNYVLMGYIKNSIYLVLGVSFTVCILGVGTAWIITNYDFSFKNFFSNVPKFSPFISGLFEIKYFSLFFKFLNSSKTSS